MEAYQNYQTRGYTAEIIRRDGDTTYTIQISKGKNSIKLSRRSYEDARKAIAHYTTKGF